MLLSLAFLTGGLVLVLALVGGAASFATRGADGERRVSGCGGCAIALALLACAGVGAGACVAGGAALAGAHALEEGPLRRVEILREPRAEAPARPWEHPLHVRLELDGPLRAEELERWLRERFGGAVGVEVTTRETPFGTITVLDLGLPVERDDLEELERELARELPWLELPEGLEIELADPDEGR